MARASSLRAAFVLVFAIGSALLPSTASRAGLGTMFTQDPCPAVREVTAAYDFNLSFVGLPNCEQLCKKAAASCVSAIKSAAACDLAFAADWTAFDSAVDCDGLTGGDKKDCKAGWAADLKLWRAQIKAVRDQAGLPTCDSFLNDPGTGCLRRCSGV